MSLSGLQSSWSPAVNGGGGGGGGSSITNGTAPDVGTVSVSADGVVAVSSTNAATAGAGSIFLETSLANHVVISPTLSDTTTVAGPVLFSAGVYSPLASYGVGSIVQDGVLGDFYVAGAPIDVNVTPPDGDWIRLCSPSTITKTDLTGGTATVSTLAGDVIATAAGFVTLTASNGSLTANATLGAVNISADAGSVVLGAGDTLTLSAGTGDADVNVPAGDINLNAGVGSVVVGAGDQITLTAGTGGIGLDSGSGSMTVTSGALLSVSSTAGNISISAPTAGSFINIFCGPTATAGAFSSFAMTTSTVAPTPGSQVGLTISPTHVYFNGTQIA